MAPSGKGGGGHPVWDIYDEFRTAALNASFYRCCARRLRRRNFALELVVAIAAPGSGVAGWFLWGTPQGKFVWAAITGVASVAAVLKPLLRWNKTIAALQDLVTAYEVLEQELRDIAIDIKQAGDLDASLVRRFNALRKQRNKIVSRGGHLDVGELPALKQRCEEEIRRAYPSDHPLFFQPPRKKKTRPKHDDTDKPES